ncbi:MAG: hypothetical protein WCK58_17120, partial [Chloroflexota bacterium]
GSLAGYRRFVFAIELGPGVPWHISRFFPAFRMRDVPPTPASTLRRAAEIGREAGLRYVYVGNAPDVQLESTQCPGCGLLLIERRGYRCSSVVAPDGSCPACARPVEGRWPAVPDGVQEWRT